MVSMAAFHPSRWGILLFTVLIKEVNLSPLGQGSRELTQSSWDLPACSLWPWDSVCAASVPRVLTEGGHS